MMKNRTKNDYRNVVFCGFPSFAKSAKVVLLSLSIIAFVFSVCFGDVLPRTLWKQKKDDAVTAAFFIHNNSEIVYSASSQGKYSRFGNISIRKSANGELVNTQVSFYPFSDNIMPITLHPNGKMVATGHLEERGGSCLTFYDLATLNRNGKAGCNSSYKASSPLFSPDGKTIATISAQRTIDLFDTSKREIVSLFGRQKNLDLISSIAFSPNSKIIASGHLDNSIVLWDISGGKQLKTFQEHTSPVTSIAFSPDGKTIVSGHLDNSIVLWDVSGGKQIKIFQEHTAQITSLAFSPNSKYLASGSKDETIKLWDLQSQKSESIATLKEHSNVILCVSFSSDGKRLVSGGADGNLILWQVR